MFQRHDPFGGRRFVHRGSPVSCFVGWTGVSLSVLTGATFYWRRAHAPIRRQHVTVGNSHFLLVPLATGISPSRSFCSPVALAVMFPL